MKIITVVGARPQFIKAAAVSRALKANPVFTEKIIHTGQHFDTNMSEIFFQELSIPEPDYNLGIGGGSHGQNTGRMIERIEEILILERPDCVLVYGDTDSTLAAALAAKKLKLRLAHVEAGLRSLNMNMPEEINRIVTDRISDFLFCPTETAMENLKNEGFRQMKVKVENVGDVMFDAFLFYQQNALRPESMPSNLYEFCLCTFHRAENTDDSQKITDIHTALIKISKDIPVILPVHPRTEQALKRNGLSFDNQPNVFTIDPVGYLQMVWLLKKCVFVITDSGGLQKETYFAKKKCITIREETEWVELVKSGVNLLTGSNVDSILTAHSTSVDFDGTDLDLYGDGNASEKICQTLLRF
jgi:UDP-GlcNAc3NAcA epimerase